MAYYKDGSVERSQHVLYSTSNSGGTKWTATQRVTATGVSAPDVTHLRAYVKPYYACADPCQYDTADHWRPVSSYIYKDHDMARTGDDLGPVYDANPAFFCSWYLMQAGTHQDRSTVSDQYLACEAALLAGRQ